MSYGIQLDISGDFDCFTRPEMKSDEEGNPPTSELRNPPFTRFEDPEKDLGSPGGCPTPEGRMGAMRYTENEETRVKAGRVG